MKTAHLLAKKNVIVKTMLILLFLIGNVQIIFSQDYGDPGWTVDWSKYDNKYTEMKTFVNAGVQGGIPYRSETPIKQIVNPGQNIQNAINAAANSGGGVVLLKNGTHKITNPIFMKSNVIVRGQSRNGAKIEVTIRATSNARKYAFIFDRVTRAGLEDLSMRYVINNVWPQDDNNQPSDRWCSQCFKNDPRGRNDLYVGFVSMNYYTNNCWVDKCNLIEAGTDPLFIQGQYITCRRNFVNRAYNKGPGGNGYYNIRARNSLFAYEKVYRLRHFVIQREARYNVIIKCNLEVDVNFHSGDDGRNLVEQTLVKLGRWRGWQPFGTGVAEFHQKPGYKNIVFNNTTQDNKGVTGKYEGNRTVYTFTGFGNPSVLSNTPPRFGTFYPLKRAGRKTLTENMDTKQTTVSPNPVNMNSSVTITGASIGKPIQIHNSIGKLIMKITATSEVHTIALDGFSSGMYFVNSNNNSKILKLIIQ